MSQYKIQGHTNSYGGIMIFVRTIEASNQAEAIEKFYANIGYFVPIDFINEQKQKQAC